MRATDRVEQPEPRSWRPLLAAVPVPNAAATVREAGGGLRVTVPRANDRLARAPWSWFLPRRREWTAELDALGAGVWRLCDGRRTVEEIVDATAAAHRLTFHEARTAVTDYLARLIRRGILAIAFAGRP
jgi:hypothetical protein